MKTLAILGFYALAILGGAALLALLEAAFPDVAEKARNGSTAKLIGVKRAREAETLPTCVMQG